MLAPAQEFKSFTSDKRACCKMQFLDLSGKIFFDPIFENLILQQALFRVEIVDLI